MGRKIEMKKIENNTKCQVTFSKRRSSLMRKAKEISVSCDVDVAFLAYSRSGRVSTFCNLDRIEALIERYADVEADKRLSHMKNVQENFEKLRQLDHINSEECKLQHLVKQIENIELDIKKETIEVQLAEANLRDYELEPEQIFSLHHLIYCERNMQQSLAKVRDRKNSLPYYSTSQWQFNNQEDNLMMGNEGGSYLCYNLGGNGLHFVGESSAGQLPSINSYSENLGEHVLQEQMEKLKGVSYASQAPNITSYNNTLNMCLYNQCENNCNSYVSYPSMHAMHHPELALAQETLNEPTNTLAQVNSQLAIPQEYPQHNFGDYIVPKYQVYQHAAMPWKQVYKNCSLGAFDVENHNLIQNNLLDFQPSFNDSMVMHLPNIMSNNNNNNNDTGDGRLLSPATFEVAPSSKVSSGLYNAFPSKDALGEEAPWAQEIQSNDTWEWEDLLFQQNHNFSDYIN